MRRVIFGLGVALALFSVSAVSSATEPAFGTKGQMAFSGDRLFGYYSWTNTWEGTPPGGSQKTEGTDSGSMLNVLWGNSGTTNDNPKALFSATPRLSFDYFVSDRISVGGSVGYTSVTGTHETSETGQKVKSDSDETKATLFAPRVGYVIPLTDLIGFWGRAGVTYVSGTNKRKAAAGQGGGTDQETEFNYLDLTLEAMFTVSPTPHFAFVAGPVLDYGLSGKRKEPSNGTTVEYDQKLTSYGLAAGVMGYF